RHRDDCALGHADQWRWNLQGTSMLRKRKDEQPWAIFSFGVPHAGADVERQLEDPSTESASRRAIVVGLDPLRCHGSDRGAAGKNRDERRDAKEHATPSISQLSKSIPKGPATKGARCAGDRLRGARLKRLKTSLIVFGVIDRHNATHAH